MLHCIQNRTFHLLNDVTPFNPLKGGLFRGKNKFTEDSSNDIFQHVYSPQKAILFSAQQRPGYWSKDIISWVFNTTNF